MSQSAQEVRRLPLDSADVDHLAILEIREVSGVTRRPATTTSQLPGPKFRA
jgi:hypothetical protein